MWSWKNIYAIIIISGLIKALIRKYKWLHCRPRKNTGKNEVKNTLSLNTNWSDQMRLPHLSIQNPPLFLRAKTCPFVTITPPIHAKRGALAVLYSDEQIFFKEVCLLLSCRHPLFSYYNYTRNSFL